MENVDNKHLESDMHNSSAPDIATLRQNLALNILRALSLVGIFVMGVATYDAITKSNWWILPFYWIAYGIVVFFSFWRNSAHQARVWILLFLIYVLAIVDFVEDGAGGSGRVFMMLLPFIGTLLLGQEVGWFAVALSVLTAATFGSLFATNVLQVADDVIDVTATRLLVGSAVLLLSGTLTTVALGYFVRQMNLLLLNSHTLAKDLVSERQGLEQLVTQRTEELSKWARYLEATAEVSQQASLVLDDPDVMLTQVIDLIGERFDFYNVSLFLLDSTGEWAQVRAASSVGGKRLVAREYRIRVGVEGIVGYVADRGEARIVRDVQTDVFYQFSEDLPNTRSEMALPLRIRGAIIGVLDVQATSPDVFSQEDIVVLQALANEVAVAISNARLFAELQESVAAERQARGELSREAWQEHLHTQKSMGFIKEKGRLLSAADIWEPRMQQAVHSGEIVGRVEQPQNVLAVPIKAGNEIVAVLDAQLPADIDHWSPDQVTLLASLSEQLGQALERARLHQETQDRATQEQLTREVTASIRESLEVETVLRSAVQEIGDRLGIEAEVWLGVDFGEETVS